ncbi:MAG: CBS domain-containing protein [Chloroflexi bacterium]|nr:CBS domain-containing protein [Chloroflexota bacterium]
MNVSEIMTGKVITVRPETSVHEVARLLVDNAITGVPVVDEHEELVGIITELDLLVQHATIHFPRYIKLLESVLVFGQRHFEEELRRTLATVAGDLMTRDVVTATPETDVAELASLMFDRRVNPVPVVVGRRVVGIVSRSDLIRLWVRLNETTAGGP